MLYIIDAGYVDEQMLLRTLSKFNTPDHYILQIGQADFFNIAFAAWSQ
jgi:hypothetical protein